MSINSALGKSPNESIVYTSVFAGAMSGVIGGMLRLYPSADMYSQCFALVSLGNPLFLIKACTQAYSPTLPVGTQHYYKSSFDAVCTIFCADGFRGLIRGIEAAILRTAIGSSVQLPSYNWTKSNLVNYGILPAGSYWTWLASSTISRACVVSYLFHRVTGYGMSNLLTRLTALSYATARYDSNTDVQPTDPKSARRARRVQNSRGTLQEPNRLPLEDSFHGRDPRVVQRCVRPWSISTTAC